MATTGPFAPGTAAQPLHFQLGCNFRAWTLHSCASLLHLCLSWQFKGAFLPPAGKPERGLLCRKSSCSSGVRSGLESSPSPHIRPSQSCQGNRAKHEGRAGASISIVTYLASVKQVHKSQTQTRCIDSLNIWRHCYLSSSVS